MTTLQATKATYAKGNKTEAFEMFKADPTSRKDITFEQFCLGFDKMINNPATTSNPPSNY